MVWAAVTLLLRAVGMVGAGWGGGRLVLCTALYCFSRPHLPSLWGLSPSSGPGRSGSGAPWEQRTCSSEVFSERLWNTLGDRKVSRV